MREYIQKGYMRIADIMPILGDIRIAYIPKLCAIPCSKMPTVRGWQNKEEILNETEVNN